MSTSDQEVKTARSYWPIRLTRDRSNNNFGWSLTVDRPLFQALSEQES